MRVTNRTRLASSWLAPLMMLGLAACYAPKPEPAAPPDLSPEDRTQVTVVREQLATAERQGTWSPDDEAKFSAAIATLPAEARLQLSKDLVLRLNQKKLKPVHPAPVPGQVVCPGLCNSGVQAKTATTTQTGATDVPAKVVPPAATGKAVAK
jgi:hypothetical protein